MWPPGSKNERVPKVDAATLPRLSCVNGCGVKMDPVAILWRQKQWLYECRMCGNQEVRG